MNKSEYVGRCALLSHAVIEHGETSLMLQTAIQKNEEELSSIVQFENKMASYHAL